MFKTIRLDIAYDGTDYCGWQQQPNGPSIEEEIKEALKKCGIEFKGFTSSGRTDSGVHARSHTASFISDTTIPPERIKYALNSHLNGDIRVIRSSEEDDQFDAHRSAWGKHYSYRIDLKEIPTPLDRRYSWHFPYPVDMEALEQAARILAGKHDYRAFMASGSSVKTTERELYIIKPEYGEGILTLHFIGNGFLYNMVRILVGTIMEAASGRRDLNKLEEAFLHPAREQAGITAPAKGLVLEEVYYSEDELSKGLADLKSRGNSI